MNGRVIHFHLFSKGLWPGIGYVISPGGRQLWNCFFSSALKRTQIVFWVKLWLGLSQHPPLHGGERDLHIRLHPHQTLQLPCWVHNVQGVLGQWEDIERNWDDNKRDYRFFPFLESMSFQSIFVYQEVELFLTPWIWAALVSHSGQWEALANIPLARFHIKTVILTPGRDSMFACWGLPSSYTWTPAAMSPLS